MPGETNKANQANLQSTIAAQGMKVAALEKSTGELRQDVEVLTTKLPHGWKAPQVVVAIVAALATFGTLAYNITKVDKLSDSLNGKVDKLADSINGKDGIKASLGHQAEREGNLEEALRLLTAVVAPELVHELDKALERSVAAAEQQGPKGVSVAVANFSDQVKFLREAKTPASQTFFSNSASTLQRVASKYPSIGPDIHPAIESLAAYHSEVVRPSNLAKIFAPKSNQPITTDDLANLLRNKDSFLKGFKVYMVSASLSASPGATLLGGQAAILLNVGGGDAFTAASGGVPGGKRIINGLLIVTPSQALDGFIWQNVVFANARIHYMGGPVTLKNVRFVNCTFDTPSKIGQPILNYAINLQPDLVLTGSMNKAG
jgi:hypothetical protein